MPFDPNSAKKAVRNPEEAQQCTSSKKLDIIVWSKLQKITDLLLR